MSKKRQTETQQSGCEKMPKAYVLFNVSSGLEIQVLKNMQKIDGVEEVFVTYGVYDLLAKVKADSMEQLKELITHHLRRVDNVRSTLTLILVEE
jgi:DNA-binding Lrp family transcriptional regulator